MNFNTSTLGPVGVIVMVIGIVEAAKRFGVKDLGCFALALGVGAAFAAYLEALAMGLIPEAVQPLVQIVVVGVGGGLAATGLFDLGKRYSGLA